MAKAQKFFRNLWRVNAIVILIAAGLVTLGVGMLLIQEFGVRMTGSREADAGIAVAGSSAGVDLQLRRASVVEGTDFMRAELQWYREGTGFSSGFSSETRNILFIVPGEPAARWLLPDHDHVIGDTTDIMDDGSPRSGRVIATAVLVKSTGGLAATATGRLVLFDPPGKTVVEVANDVREIHVASVSAGKLSILYERDKRLVLAVFDSRTIARLGEQDIEIPQLQ